MTLTYAIVLALLACVGLSVAAVRLIRQARADRQARVEAERQRLYSDQLQRLTATLSRARTPRDVIHVSLPDLLHAAAAEAGAIALVCDNDQRCEIAHAIGYDDATLQRGMTRPTASNSVVAEAMRHRDLIVVDTRESRGSDSRARALDPLLDASRGAVAIPLTAAGRALGAVAMSLLHARAVDGEEREFLLSAGRHIAQALDRARLYEEAEQARSEAEALRSRADAALRERQLVEEALRQSEGQYRSLSARTSRLYALSAGLSAALTPDAMARVMVSRGKVVAGAAAGSVAVLTADGSTFIPLYAEEFPWQPDQPGAYRAEPGLCATAAVTTREPVFVTSFAEWQEKYPRSASMAADGGFSSGAALPLLADGAAIGVVSLYFTAPVNFDDEYRALLVSLAQHCAQALERARLYEAAERARSQAEAANRSKDDFLSTISHELRTPLNAILGWAAMLRGGSVDPSKMARGLDAIFNNATRQGRLIEELLDVSRIVAGRASVDLQSIDLGEVIRGTVETMMPTAAAKGVEIAVASPPPTFVTGDPRRLEQVFLNLLANAVKFTPPGGHVEIDVVASDSAATVRVSDTGAGIDPAFLPHVFDRFRQGDSTTTRSVGGLGLGLFIARHLVEAQNGTIRVESEGAGRGAVFTVTLPVARVAGEPAFPLAAPDAVATRDMRQALTGVRVLLVDDEPDAREMMATALETCGATVVSAASADDAILALGRSPVDVLLADIAMPDKDGYELIREVRSTTTSRIAAVPAAAVTAHAREDERQRALAAGYQMHLAKPVDPTALAHAVVTLAKTGAARG
jgi:signal transduction histidine kinase/ActR/RegA family two-component response regulator